MENHDSAVKKNMTRAFLSNRLLYPNERVVAFLAKYYGDIRQNSALKGLDVGCGSGRHINLMLDYGLQANGVDFVEEACKRSSEILQERDSRGDVYCGDFYGHYANETFDIIICLGAIFLRQIELMKRDLTDIYRIIKKGGRMIIDFRTNEDCLYGKGEKIDEYSFMLDERAGAYNSILYTFLSSKQAEELLVSVGFTVENIERVELWKNNLADRHTWWHFTVKK